MDVEFNQINFCFVSCQKTGILMRSIFIFYLHGKVLFSNICLAFTRSPYFLNSLALPEGQSLFLARIIIDVRIRLYTSAQKGGDESMLPVVMHNKCISILGYFRKCNIQT